MKYQAVHAIFGKEAHVQPISRQWYPLFDNIKLVSDNWQLLFGELRELEAFRRRERSGSLSEILSVAQRSRRNPSSHAVSFPELLVDGVNIVNFVNMWKSDKFTA